MPDAVDPKLALDKPEDKDKEGRERQAMTTAMVWQRRAEWATLQSDGHYLHDIARKYGVDTSTVSRGIHALIKAQKELGISSLEEKQAKALVRLDFMETELVEAWFASKDGKTFTVSEEIKKAMHNHNRKQRRKGERPQGQGTGHYKRSTRHESSAGDPRYMSLLLEIQKERNKIMNIYPLADKEREDDAAKLTPEERAVRITALIEAAKRARAVQQGAGVPVTIDVTPGPVVDAVQRPAIDTSVKPEI